MAGVYKTTTRRDMLEPCWRSLDVCARCDLTAALAAAAADNDEDDVKMAMMLCDVVCSLARRREFALIIPDERRPGNDFIF